MLESHSPPACVVRIPADGGELIRWPIPFSSARYTLIAYIDGTAAILRNLDYMAQERHMGHNLLSRIFGKGEEDFIHPIPLDFRIFMGLRELFALHPDPGDPDAAHFEPFSAFLDEMLAEEVKTLERLYASPVPSGKRLTISPEAIEVDGGRIYHDHPAATAFSIVGETVASTRRTHPFIFNAIIAVASEAHRNDVQMDAIERKGVMEFYRSYGVEFAPHSPDPRDLDWFSENYVGETGEMRHRTRSGRVWKDVRVGGKNLTALSFWTARAQTSEQDVARVVAALALETPVWVEFIDSTEPRLW